MTVNLILDMVCETEDHAREKEDLECYGCHIVYCPNGDIFLASKRAFFITVLRQQS